MRHYVGLDVSLRETSICVIDQKRKIVREAKVASESETIAAWLEKTGLAFEAVGLLTAIRNKNGNLVQPSDSRQLFEAIAVKIRADFLEATGDVLRPSDAPIFDRGTVDFRRDGRRPVVTGSGDDEETAAQPTMGIDQRVKVSTQSIKHTERTGAAWNGSVERLIYTKQRQTRADRLVWACLPSVGPKLWAREFTRTSGPHPHGGEGVVWLMGKKTQTFEMSKPPKLGTADSIRLASDVEALRLFGQRRAIPLRVVRQEVTRSDSAGTSTWRMTTRTPIDEADAEGSTKWCLLRQTVAASVDFGNLDMIRDPAPVEVRIAAQQRLLLLHSCLGADLFETLRCWARSQPQPASRLPPLRLRARRFPWPRAALPTTT